MKRYIFSSVALAAASMLAWGENPKNLVITDIEDQTTTFDGCYGFVVKAVFHFRTVSQVDPDGIGVLGSGAKGGGRQSEESYYGFSHFV